MIFDYTTYNMFLQVF